jgi:predicted AAA+ superfamily ATPase
MTNLLEILYATEFKKPSFYPRKFSFKADKTLLVGPKKSGKSTIIFDYLSTKKKGSFLYIDFADLRLSQAIIFGLPTFIQTHKITLLVLENFDFSFKIPNCKEVIITTCAPKELEGFTTQVLYPLDFEEFIAFEKRQLDTQSIFNDYATWGTYPAVVLSSKENFTKLFQDHIRLMCESDLEFTILRHYALSQGVIISSFALFNEIKVFHKISKDKFYTITKKLQAEKMLFLLQRYGAPKADKRVYLIDFAIKSVLTFDKDFIKRFENIIFLELLKSDTEVYFTDFINFYIPAEKKAIIAMPFIPISAIKTKLKRIEKELEKYEVAQVEIITLEGEEEFYHDNIFIEILPFWSWALQR